MQAGSVWHGSVDVPHAMQNWAEVFRPRPPPHPLSARCPRQEGKRRRCFCSLTPKQRLNDAASAASPKRLDDGCTQQHVGAPALLQRVQRPAIRLPVAKPAAGWGQGGRVERYMWTGSRVRRARFGGAEIG